jgi:hypothetical protein
MFIISMQSNSVGMGTSQENFTSPVKKNSNNQVNHNQSLANTLAQGSGGKLFHLYRHNFI